MKRYALLALLGGVIGGFLSSRMEGTAHAGITEAATRIAEAVERIARTMEVSTHKKEKPSDSCSAN